MKSCIKPTPFISILLLTLLAIAVSWSGVLERYSPIDHKPLSYDRRHSRSDGTREVSRSVVTFVGAPDKIEQCVYASRDGEYSLTMQPNDAFRKYGSSYRFARKATPLWFAERPFTLWDAVVTETGMVVGYAYTGGIIGLTESDDVRGDLVLTMIDCGGAIRLRELISRSGHTLHAPPLPTVSGLVLDEPNDRILLRMKDRYFDKTHEFWQLRESWRCYRLSTTEFIERIDPFEKLKVSVPHVFLNVSDARLIAGTPLILVHWVHESQGMGAIFTLVNPQGEHVWTIELPQDYEGFRGEQGERIRRGLFRGRGAVLRTDQPGRFDVFFAKVSQHVTFSVVETSPGHWRVAEVDRRSGTWEFQKP